MGEAGDIIAGFPGRAQQFPVGRGFLEGSGRVAGAGPGPREKSARCPGRTPWRTRPGYLVRPVSPATTNEASTHPISW